MNEIHYENKKINTDKLQKIGFCKNGDTYEYKTAILDGELEMCVSIDSDGTVRTRVTDSSCGDEYVLHLVDSAVGSYVGKVREAHKAFVSYIYNHCFESEIYVANQAKAVTEYALKKYGESQEFPWSDTNSIIRRTDNGKWYAAFLKISAKKIGLETDEVIEILNLKMKPSDVERFVDGKKYFTAYHMNKKHWVTIPLDTAIPTDELLSRLDDSRELVR